MNAKIIYIFWHLQNNLQKYTLKGPLNSRAAEDEAIRIAKLEKAQEATSEYTERINRGEDVDVETFFGKSKNTGKSQATVKASKTASKKKK